MFVPVLVGQLIGTWGIISSMQDIIATGDVVALLETSTERPSYVQFASGFSLSIAATLGTAALIGGMRLLVPYRNGSLRVVQYCTGGQVLIVVANIAGLMIGNKVLDAATAGTLATVLYSVPVLVLSSNRFVRAWSVRFQPPPPPLPN